MSLYGGEKTLLWEMKVNVYQDNVGTNSREKEKQVLSAGFMCSLNGGGFLTVTFVLKKISLYLTVFLKYCIY